MFFLGHGQPYSLFGDISSGKPPLAYNNSYSALSSEVTLESPSVSVELRPKPRQAFGFGHGLSVLSNARVA